MHFIINPTKKERVSSLCFYFCKFKQNSSYKEQNNAINKFPQQVAVLYALDCCCSRSLSRFLSLSPSLRLPVPPGTRAFYDWSQAKHTPTRVPSLLFCIAVRKLSVVANCKEPKNEEKETKACQRPKQEPLLTVLLICDIWQKLNGGSSVSQLVGRNTKVGRELFWLLLFVGSPW